MSKKHSHLAIITTVSNFSLYKKTARSFPKDIPLYVIDGRNGMHGLNSIFFMFKRLKRRGVKWLIMVDEDVHFVYPGGVLELIEYMEENNFKICGVRDGGVIPHRKYNPYFINTFFSILDFENIEKHFNISEIKRKPVFSGNSFNDDLEALKHSFDEKSYYEPYYCFYFWLRRKGFEFLFLDAATPFEDDYLSNAVYLPNGKSLLYHSWHARSYGRNKKHTLRMDKIFDMAGEKDRMIDPIVFKDKTFAIKQKTFKFLRRARLKIKLEIC